MNMSTYPPFPFGHPAATVVYVLLYVLTLSIHVVFMNYVLAGSFFMAFLTLFPGRDQSRAGSMTMAVLRDWMPFFISAAITAGIAPLLFIQILYQTEFYTANLLLFSRWMAILPALIVGFYFAYLLKTDFLKERHPLLRGIIAIVAVACFCYVAFAWTENYSLSVRSQMEWADFYQKGRLLELDMGVLSRLMIWISGAFPTMAAMLGWQLWYCQRRGQEVSRAQMRLIAILAVAGWIGSVLFAFLYSQTLTEFNQFVLIRKYDGLGWVIMAATGGVLSVGSWIVQWQQWRFRAWCLIVASTGSLLGIVGMNMLRELLRSIQLTISMHYDDHAAYAKVGGITLFLGCLIANAILSAVCFFLVRRGKLAVEPEAGGELIRRRRCDFRCLDPKSRIISRHA